MTLTCFFLFEFCVIPTRSFHLDSKNWFQQQLIPAAIGSRRIWKCVSTLSKLATLYPLRDASISHCQSHLKVWVLDLYKLPFSCFWDINTCWWLKNILLICHKYTSWLLIPFQCGQRNNFYVVNTLNVLRFFLWINLLSPLENVYVHQWKKVYSAVTG